MIDPDDKATMVKMRGLNYDIEEIASELGVSRNTVTRHLKELREAAESTGETERIVVKTLMEGIIQEKSAEELMIAISSLSD